MIAPHHIEELCKSLHANLLRLAQRMGEVSLLIEQAHIADDDRVADHMAEMDELAKEFSGHMFAIDALKDESEDW